MTMITNMIIRLLQINLWIMLIPLLIGILIPARPPLNSSAVSAKGLTTSSALISSDSASRL